MSERKKYVLQVQRGEELSLHRCEEICSEESIMRPSYEKAMQALMRIMHRTRRFHEDNDQYSDGLDVFSFENQLFGYSGNIIAFAAPRGGGKTATMLSFSNILKEGFGSHSSFKNTDNSFLNTETGRENEKSDEWLRKCKFIPMTPIAPAVLEGDQNILYVVLSRLYRYAERLIKDRGRLDRIKEAEKNELIRSLQKVLSGINGIKHPEKKYPGDLAGMQDVCDGLSLSRHFYNLVQCILKLAAEDHAISDRYLVIQLDDADSKMQRVYDVLEDVRKYLMIPNLVIVMSVDPKCMSDVVFQDNLRCFPDMIRIDQERLSNDLSKITNKYIDKLIPPTYMVQLPQLDQIVVHWDDMLQLRYVDIDKPDIYKWMTHKGIDLQTAILMLIYRKTHILFVKPEHYMHNIIPRSLRGFNQLLTLLDSMENIPELTSEKYDSVKVYAEAVLKQSEIVAINQRRFLDYFKNRWISAKITNLEDLEFLRKFADTVSANRIRLAANYLGKRYNMDDYSNIRKREELDKLMREIDPKYRTEKDFRLMFAIRTMFTLDSYQHILKEKRKGARDYLDKVEENSEEINDLKFLLFDLSPDKMRIPNILWIDKAAEKIIEQYPDHAKTAEEYRALLTPLLMLGNSDYDYATREVERFSPDHDNKKIRQILHHAQEFAVMIYGNSDVSCAIMNYLKDHVQLGKNVDSKQVTDEYIRDSLITAIMKQVDDFNDGYLKAYIVNGGITIDQKAKEAWNDPIVKAIINANTAIAEKARNQHLHPNESSETNPTEAVGETQLERIEQTEDTKKGVATTVADNMTGDQARQNFDPKEQPQSDQGKAIQKLDDEG